MHKVVFIIALGMVFYQLLSTQILIQDMVPHLNTHLGLSLILVFLVGFLKADTTWKRASCIFLCGLSVVTFLNIQLQWEELQTRAYFNTSADLVIGTILMLLCLEAVRRELGLFLPLLILVVVFYPFIGHHLPEPLYCHSLGFSKTVSKLAIALESGVFQFLSVSTNYIFPFAVFGSLLQSLGGTEFFMEVARRLARKILELTYHCFC